MKNTVYLIVLLCSVCIAVEVYSQTGFLDHSFSDDGIVLTDFAGQSDGARAAALQPDGKIVTAGFAEGADAYYYDFALARYHADGSLDTTFGIDGKVTTQTGIYNSIIHDIVIQDDGKIIAAGNCVDDSTGYDIAVVRYTSSGELDTSFNETGIVILNMNSDEYAFAVTLQSDKKIIVGGYASTSEYSTDFLLLRLNENGTADTSFNHSGIVMTEGSGIIFSLLMQDDGKILASGSDFTIARYLENGELDSTFGTNGLGTAYFPAYGATSTCSYLMEDGRIVLAGKVYNGFDSDYALARYNSDGTLDNTFGTSGISYSSPDYSNEITDILLDAEGKILAAGIYWSPGSAYDFGLSRYWYAGHLDYDFGVDSKILIDMGSNQYDEPFSILQQDDGKILLAGTGGNGVNTDFAIIRFQEILDPVEDATSQTISLSIFPNPAQSVIRIQNNSEYTIHTFRTINIMGEEVELFFTSDLAGDCSKLQPGVYITTVLINSQPISLLWSKL